IFVSSHLMSEMQETAEHVLVIGRGRLIADVSMTEFIRRSSGGHVKVTSPQAAMLIPLLVQAGASVTNGTNGDLIVTEVDAARIGDIAAEHRIPLHELSPQHASLEAAFMELTRDSVDFHAGGASTNGSDGRVPALTSEGSN
ncbi:MAG: ABC transporter ATP-binding protein, partial [Dehalococcoidia bacterium]